MTEQQLQRVTIAGNRVPAAVNWADKLVIRAPSDIAVAMGDRELLGLTPEEAVRFAECAAELRLRRAFLAKPPAAARLPVSYRTIPGPVRRLIAGVIGRARRSQQSAWAEFPGWPLDLSVDVLADIASGGTGRIGPKTPVLLTHDIDSAEGLSNLVSMFLPIEESAGARSANYVVPFAWPLDHDLISEAQSRGHEIGVHGFDHSGKTPFMEQEPRRERIAQGSAFGARYGAVGYRAPSLVRTQELLADLEHAYRYDSSIPTSGGPFPVANNGCATARPWKIGKLWEIPLSLPRDGSLRFLGYSPREIAKMWIDCADLIARSGGVVVLLTHCEAGFSGNDAMLASYRSFIEFVTADTRFEFVLPSDLVSRLES